MKSLLVDALRNREGKGDKPSEPAVADELELATSANPPEVIEPDTIVAEAADPGELTLADDVVSEPVFELDTTDDLAPANDATLELDIADVVGNEASESLLPPVAATAGTPWLQRVAFLTPLVCLTLGSVSAAGYFAYTYAGAHNLNADLGALPAHVDTADGVGATASTSNAFLLAAVAKPAPVSTSAPPADQQPARAVAPVDVTPIRQSEDPAFAIVEDAYAAWKSGDAAMAEQHYRRALDISPRHRNALLGLGAVLQNTERQGEAFEVYTQLLSVDPNNDVAAAALVAADGSATDERIRVLLNLHPESAPLHFAFGNAMVEENRWPEARIAYETALSLAPDRPDYAFNLAVANDHVGRYRDAETYYRRALELGAADAGMDRAVVTSRLDALAARKTAP